MRGKYPYTEWEDKFDDRPGLKLIKELTETMKCAYDKMKSECTTYGELEDKVNHYLLGSAEVYNQEYYHAIKRGMCEIMKVEKDNLPLVTNRQEPVINTVQPLKQT